jgi:chromosome segregation ATPase
MRAAYAERLREIAARAEGLPRELEELDARIMRLRERLKAGDPDLTADELQVAIDRAEAKRRELIGRAASILGRLRMKPGKPRQASRLRAT